MQLVDDVLDFTGSSLIMGKPTLSDLRNGLATAPVLFAAEEFPELVPLIERKFQAPGDVDQALELIGLSLGVEKTRTLATTHVEKAVEQVWPLYCPPSPPACHFVCECGRVHACMHACEHVRAYVRAGPCVPLGVGRVGLGSV